MNSLLTQDSLKFKNENKTHTQEFFSQHAQLLLVEALAGEGGKLPAEDLGELAPGGPRRVTEERQVLSRLEVRLKTGLRSHTHTITAGSRVMLATTTAAHPGLFSQKVVPHDGRPASRQLAHVRDDHQR